MNGWSQAVHILRKDVQHLYREIWISLLVVVAFAWIVPNQWPGYAFSSLDLRLAGAVLHGLLPLTWVIVISQLVHDESLVGDRQFWLTRPYRWYSLLGAKVLFIALFLALPLVLMQMYLLHHAGLSVVSNVGGLLGNVAMIAMVFWLPFVALATVTTGFGGMILSLLGGLLYCALVGLGESYLTESRVASSYLGVVCCAFFVVWAAAIVLLQYTQRRTRLARVSLAATPVVLAVIAAIGSAGALVEREYPDVAPEGAVATVNMDPLHQAPANGRLLHVGRKLMLSVPLDLAGVPPGGLEETAEKVELSGANGFHWESPWRAGRQELTNGFSKIAFTLPQSVVDQAGSTPVRMRLSLGVERLANEQPVSVVMTEADAKVPERGVCSLKTAGFEVSPVCRFPFGGPKRMLVTAAVAPACGPNQEPVTGRVALNSGGMPFVFDPVETAGLFFRTRNEMGGPGALRPACPGSPIDFTVSRPAGKAQMHVEQGGMTLTNYLEHMLQIGPVLQGGPAGEPGQE